MPPPELARDAPGLDVAHPFEEGVLPALRHEDRAAALDRGDRRLGERLGVDVPLVGEPGLEHGAGAVAMRHHQGVRLDALDQALRLQIGDDALARLEAVKAAIGLGRVVVEPGVPVEDVDELEAMAAADLEIVEVVRRGDLDRPAAGGGVGIGVGDDGDAPSDQRQDHVAADEIPVALVLGMDRDAGIAEHRLRPRRRDDDEPVGLALDRVFEVPERAPGSRGSRPRDRKCRCAAAGPN